MPGRADAAGGRNACASTDLLQPTVCLVLRSAWYCGAKQSPRRPGAARIRSATRFRLRTERIVRSVTGLGGEALAGLTADVGQLLTAAPVTDKKLIELSVTWSGLPTGEARMAEALRVFMLTWDPLEMDAPRPDGFAAVNPGLPGLEIAVYVPIWRLIDLAAARHEPIAATLTAIAGSAVVTAAVHGQEVTAGRYPALVVEHSVPDLIGRADRSRAGPRPSSRPTRRRGRTSAWALSRTRSSTRSGRSTWTGHRWSLRPCCPVSWAAPRAGGDDSASQRTCRKRRDRCAQPTASRPTLSSKSAGPRADPVPGRLPVPGTARLAPGQD